MKISKTLSLRIVRLYYKPEADIKAEKDKREAKGLTRSLDAKFFNSLKKKYPEMISSSEFYGLLGLKERDNFFGGYLRMYWNYGQLQYIIENKLKEYGIEVRYISPKNTSKKCHSCNHINEFFTFEYRQKIIFHFLNARSVELSAVLITMQLRIWLLLKLLDFLKESEKISLNTANTAL